MSEHGLDKTGFTPKRLDTILDEINSDTKSIFGESLNVSPSSPDGQFNGVNAESRADLWELALAVYAAFDPKAAQGTALSRLVQLNGITRKAATFSTAVCTFTGINGTVIPVGFEVAVAGGGEIFKTVSSGTITAGLANIDMIAVNSGQIVAEAGTLTSIVSPLNGVVTVTNALSADVGANEETDIELRKRQTFSTQQASQYLIGTMYGAILKLDNVKSVFIHENDTPFTNSLGIPAHSFNAIVAGGDDNEIAETIRILKTPGVMSFGNTSVNVIDEQGITRVVKFSRPTLVDIYVTINTTETTQFPGDGVAQIQKAIIDYATENFLIGSTIERTRLYTPINSISGHVVQELFIGLAPNPTGTSDIPIAFNAIGQFLTTNIVVNVT